MCGCCRLAASRISRSKRSLPMVRRHLGRQHLDGDLTAVLDILREVDGGHAATAELAVDAVPVGERATKTVEEVGHELGVWED